MDYNRYASIIIEQQDTICYICDIDTYELMYVSPAGRRIVGAVSDAGWLGHKCYKPILYKFKAAAGGKILLGVF